jgi:hypothetical protein
MLRVLYINTMAGRKVNYQNLTWGKPNLCRESRPGRTVIHGLRASWWYIPAPETLLYTLVFFRFFVRDISTYVFLLTNLR